MSAYICISPNVNSYWFSEATNNGLNVLGQSDFAHQIQPFQYGAGEPATVYYAKAVDTDVVTLQFHTQFNGIGDAHFPKLYICDRLQNIIGSINLNVAPYLKGYQAISGHVYTDPLSGAITPLLSSMWSFTWTAFSLANGIYYIRLDNPDSTGTIWTYFSEPIYLYESNVSAWGYEFGWKDTLYFSAQYSANRMQNTNIIISNWYNDYPSDLLPFNPVFNMRCEGFLLPADMQMINIGYLQQNYDAVFITGQQVPKRILKVGELSRGIPDYMLQMISEYLIADRCFINNTGRSITATAQWYKLAGANNSTAPSDLWKAKRTDEYPLLYASCPLMLGSIAQQAMVTPYSVPPTRIHDSTFDSTFD